jgi:preprotein translocase subunit SecY
MALEDIYITFLRRMPGIASPIRKLTFRDKLKWTGIILLIYFVMSQITVYGIAERGYEQLRFLEILLGSSLGSLMSLGIGPIVTASIILQLLVGSKIIPWNLNTEEGKILFQGTQKLLGIALSFIEAIIFVMVGTVPAASPALSWIVMLQLAAGGIFVIFMDELISKWGFGSGIGLFIVAGVSKTIIIRTFNPLTQGGGLPGPGNPPTGLIPSAITLLGAGEPLQAFLTILPIIATLLVFCLVIYINAIKVEIPLAFGSIRGFGRRWPLKFLYTSNIPVILTAALLANIQLMGRTFSRSGWTWLAQLDAQGNPVGGLIYFLTPPRTEALSGLIIFIGIFVLLGVVFSYFIKRQGWKIISGFAALGAIFWYLLIINTGITSLATIGLTDIARIITYSSFMIGGAMIFSIFWVTTAGMSAKNVAEQIQSTGMQIPGYRRDIRIIERVLDRYIPVLTILGGATVGFLASYADFTGALGTGTGILLATMIIYQLYEEIAMQHMEDMHPAVRRLLSR